MVFCFEPGFLVGLHFLQESYFSPYSYFSHNNFMQDMKLILFCCSYVCNSSFSELKGEAAFPPSQKFGVTLKKWLIYTFPCSIPKPTFKQILFLPLVISTLPNFCSKWLLLGVWTPPVRALASQIPEFTEQKMLRQLQNFLEAG